MTFWANLFSRSIRVHTAGPSKQLDLYSHASRISRNMRALHRFHRRDHYLIQERALKSKHPVRFYNWLPSLDIC